MDASSLIVAMHLRTALWDKNHPLYQNRFVKPKLWSEIAAEVGCSVYDAKRKWSNLRDQFRVELKKMYGTKDAGKPYVSSWAYFEPMSFIKQYLGTATPHIWKKNRGRPNRPPPDTDSVFGQDQETEVDEWADGADDKSSLEALKGNFPMVKCEEVAPHKPPEDDYDDCDTELFLKSLIPALKSLPYPKQLFVRARIQEILAEELSKTCSESSQTSQCYQD